MTRLEADDGREWFSLHWTSEDAERQLEAVGTAWGVEFTPDGDPADRFRRYGAEEVLVLGPDESGEAPEESSEFKLTDEEMGTWTWLIDRRVPGGLSADEMARRPRDPLRRRGSSAGQPHLLELAHQVSPGCYRSGPKAE